MNSFKRLSLLIFTLLLILPAAADSLRPVVKSTLSDDGLLRISVALPDGYYQEADKSLFNIVLAEEQPFELQNLRYPPPENPGQRYTGEVIITGRLVGITDEPPRSIVCLTINYQLCSPDGFCLMPSSEEHLFIARSIRRNSSGN